MTYPTSPGARRRIVHGLIGGVASLAMPLLARAALPPMTEGPFYPSANWRTARQLDWDADLTRVSGKGGEITSATGEYLDLGGIVTDAQGRVIDGAEIEIWQCDIHGSYRHPRGAGSRVDEGFQGFGSTRSDAQGRYRFRTIKPAPYPGRTPHIHVLLRHPSFGERVSQLFVAGEPGNAGDFLYRRLSAAQRADTEMRLLPAPGGSEVRWLADRPLVVGR